VHLGYCRIEGEREASRRMNPFFRGIQQGHGTPQGQTHPQFHPNCR